MAYQITMFEMIAPFKLLTGAAKGMDPMDRLSSFAAGKEVAVDLGLSADDLETIRSNLLDYPLESNLASSLEKARLKCRDLLRAATLLPDIELPDTAAYRDLGNGQHEISLWLCERDVPIYRTLAHAYGIEQYTYRAYPCVLMRVEE